MSAQYFSCKHEQLLDKFYRKNAAKPAHDVRHQNQDVNVIKNTLDTDNTTIERHNYTHKKCLHNLDWECLALNSIFVQLNIIAF